MGEAMVPQPSEPEGRPPRLGIFWASVITLVASYVVLKWGFAWLTMRIVERDELLPIPGSALQMLMGLVVVGLGVYILYDDALMREFTRPIIRLLSAREGPLGAARLAVLILFPLLVGVGMFTSLKPSTAAAVVSRIQHPTIPGAYERLENPFRNPEPEMLNAFAEAEGLSGLSPQEVEGHFDARTLEEGRILYQMNCRPCHGTKVDGTGPMAPGLLLKPANFTDLGTIATLIEAYLFWRIKEGGIALPGAATPWDSVMPAWKDELSDDEIWKIILAEYHTAGVAPRILDKLH